jgi:DNA-binding PadR family transcriptional regulator
LSRPRSRPRGSAYSTRSPSGCRPCRTPRPPLVEEPRTRGDHSHSLTMGRRIREHDDIPPGTLYMLILKTLARGPMHGYGIAQRIHQLQTKCCRSRRGRCTRRSSACCSICWVTAEWCPSQNNRRARYYELTAEGRRQLAMERSTFHRVVNAITRVLETAGGNGSPHRHARAITHGRWSCADSRAASRTPGV